MHAEQLQTLLGWLVANGVEGVGASDSRVGVYSGEDGERGLAALAPIGANEVLLRVPLRLAITDHVDEDEEEGTEGGVEGQAGGWRALRDAPWSLRLAARLLELRAQGDSCPWAAYIATLPVVVPSPLTAFTWEDVEAVEARARGTRDPDPPRSTHRDPQTSPHPPHDHGTSCG